MQTGNLLFLSGMLPTEGRMAKFAGREGAELDVEVGRRKAPPAALNVLAVARRRYWDLSTMKRIVRLGVSLARPEIFANRRRSPTPLQNCGKTFCKTKGLAAWCMALQSLQFDTLVELEDS